MKRKTAVYKGLEFIPVFFQDTSLTSPEYFQITEFPTRLTAGKNLFKLRGHPTNLRIGGVLNVEVLDYNGDPIYTEVVDYIDDDKSRVIAIYIYEETSPGDCTITLIAEAQTINGIPVPLEWQGRSNLKWTRSIPVNPNISNISEIIFSKLPDIEITEQVGVQLDRVYKTIQYPIYNTGLIRYFTLNGQPAIEIVGGKFNGDMSTGTITVPSPVNPTPTPNFTTPTTQFSSTIKKILSDATALLDREYEASNEFSIFPHTYSNFDYSAFSISYEATPQYIPTENSQSFALLQIKNLDPDTGDVSRIKVYTTNKGTVGTWELVNDVELEETEIFIPNTASLFPDVSIGTFTTQSVIDTYWDAYAYSGKTTTTTPTLQWSTGSLNNAMQIVSANSLTNRNSVLVVETKPQYAGIFIATSSYKVTIDAIGTRSSDGLNPKLSVYISGSAIAYDTTDYFNQELPRPLGQRIGDIEVTSDSQRFDDIVFNFETTHNGTATLLLVVESGQWQVADIRTTTDNDSGFTPNYTRIRSIINTPHKANNQISFKIEYYNVDGVKSRQTSYVYNQMWQGGNRYIDGDYSMLTGSLYVADSLESGIAISGYKNSGFIRSLGYDGFDAGFPGFLLWSGSALSGSFTKYGNPYAGVGLELYLNTSSYFRYSTADNEIYVATDNFFFGNPNGTFISGSNGLLQISSSGFVLNTNGTVTASAFTSIDANGNVLFDSNNEFVDGNNIGRVVYFDRNEFEFIGNMNTTPQTASIFETFILPGETRMQVSFTTEFKNNTADIGSIGARWFIQSASFTSINANGNNYDTWSEPQILNGNLPTNTTTIITVNNNTTEGTSPTFEITLTPTGRDNFANCQGKYVRIFMVVLRTSSGNGSDEFRIKNFVYRTSRVIGGSIITPATPIK